MLFKGYIIYCYVVYNIQIIYQYIYLLNLSGCVKKSIIGSKNMNYQNRYNKITILKTQTKLLAFLG